MSGMNTNMKTKFLAIAGLTGALALGACSAGVDSNGGDPEVTASSSSNVVTKSPEATTDAATVDADPDPGTDVTDADSDGDSQEPGAGSVGVMREEMSEGVVTELTCPDGTVEINTTASAVEVVEDCDVININADVSTVIAQQVGTLNLDASGTVVLIAGADVVNLAASGSVNTVVWESGNPIVNDLSTSSVVVSESRMQ